MKTLWERTDVSDYVNINCREHEIRRVFEGYMARVTCIKRADIPYTDQPIRLESWLRGWEMADKDMKL